MTLDSAVTDGAHVLSPLVRGDSLNECLGDLSSKTHLSVSLLS